MWRSRRNLIASAAAYCGLMTIPASASARTSIHVYKGRGCGCCTAWTKILRKEGFTVTDEELLPANLVQLKISKGVPKKMFSCHTAAVGQYIVEGHVPPADIRWLLREKPDALGLAVPGMPYGSPGMGPETEREAYDVYLFAKGTEPKVFSHYEAA